MADAADGGSAGGSLGAQAMAAVDSGEVEAGVDTTVAADDSDGGGSAEPSGGDPGESHEGHTDDERTELEKFFADDDGEPAEKPAEKEGAQAQNGSRAERRIRALNSRVKELAAQNEQFQRYAQQMQQQHQQELARWREQNARWDERMRAMGPQQEPDPVQQFKAEVLAEAKKQVGGELNPQIQQALQRIQQYEQQRAADQRMAQQRQNVARLNQMADAAVEQHIAPKVGTMEPAERDFYAQMVLTVKATRQTDMESAAKIVRRQLNGYARSSIKHGYKARGDKLRASQAAADPTPNGVGGARGDSYPDWDRLRSAGYKSYHQWEIKGRPKV